MPASWDVGNTHLVTLRVARPAIGLGHRVEIRDNRTPRTSKQKVHIVGGLAKEDVAEKTAIHIDPRGPCGRAVSFK